MPRWTTPIGRDRASPALTHSRAHSPPCIRALPAPHTLAGISGSLSPPALSSHSRSAASRLSLACLSPSPPPSPVPHDLRQLSLLKQLSR